MNTRQTLILGNERFRVGPWHADPAIAYLSLTPDVPRPSVEGLHRCVRRLGDEGYSSVITAALHPDEARPFLELGFVEYDRLRVLGHSLEDLDPPRRRPGRAVRLRRARHADRETALGVDGRAFPRFWQLDEDGLDEAIRATPKTRFRVAERGGVVVGYAVTGRAGSQGFLQRLATDPEHQGDGVASSLVIDALHWAARRRVRRVLVNTQEGNARALALYRQLGFELTPTDLVVLSRPVP
ncbi:MAG: GNAT family N-acetyltransferase [Microthrixaceae bacterium]